MLAKAGEGDRAIKVKMVSWVIDQLSFFLNFFWLLFINSPSTCSLGNGKLEKRTEDKTKEDTHPWLSILWIHIYIYIDVYTLIICAQSQSFALVKIINSCKERRYTILRKYVTDRDLAIKTNNQIYIQSKKGAPMSTKATKENAGYITPYEAESAK